MSQNYSHFEREQIIWQSPLTKDEKFTLLALNSFIGADGRCFPGNRRLASMLSVPVSTARRYLSSLEKQGILKRVRKYRDNGGETSSEKIVSFDAIKSLTPCSPVSNPMTISEQGAMTTSEHPPCSPVSNQELSNRTIQKRTDHTTTTSQGEGSSSDDNFPLGKEGKQPSFEKEVGKYVARICRNNDLHVTVTNALIKACKGKTYEVAAMNVCAVVEKSQQIQIRQPQGMMTKALQECWAPSAEMFDSLSLEWKRIYLGEFVKAMKSVGLIDGYKFTQEHYTVWRNDAPMTMDYLAIPLIDNAQGSLSTLWEEIKYQEVA